MQTGGHPKGSKIKRAPLFANRGYPKREKIRGPLICKQGVPKGD